MSDAQPWHILPQDLMELQLGQIDLLMAMYPSSEEVTMTDDSRAYLDSLRNYYHNFDSGVSTTTAPIISLLLDLDVSQSDEGTSTSKRLQLDISVPCSYEGTEPPNEPPSVRVRIRQPPWMSRALTSQLMSKIPTDEDLFSIIEHVKDAVARQQELSEEQLQTSNDVQGSVTLEPLVRVWFYFPSISTRSKRDDLITHAPLYNLTGFLYAGKPGLLCLEGGSQRIDEYMKFIKTESWGDIPAHHKKVSERYRESSERVFVDMQEITDSVGERRGKRVNRGDMKALEAWLVEKGLGDAFAKVLI